MTKMLFQCKCGNEFITNFKSFKDKKKQQCNECAFRIRGQKSSLSKDEILKIVYENLGENWAVIDIYKFKKETHVALRDPEGYLYSKVRVGNIRYQKQARFTKQNLYTIQNIKTWCKQESKPFELISDEYKGRDEKMQWLCGQCNNIFISDWHNIYSSNGRCNICPDNISYGEKFIHSLLNQLNQNYISEFTPKWAESKRYDFYLPDVNTIIEVHGEQHYNETGLHQLGKRSLEQIQQNDKYKKQMATNNYIDNYIIIDCRESDFKHIKKSILESKLSILFNLNEINWSVCHEFALSSLVKVVCDYYNTGKYTTTQIGEIFKIDRSTVREYLKKGNEINLCEYDPQLEMRKNGIKNGQKGRKPVLRFSINGEFIDEFNSLTQASYITGISLSSLCNCLKGKTKTSGGYVWKYKLENTKEALGRSPPNSKFKNT